VKMRLLLDASFPEPMSAYSQPGIELERWQGQALSDVELLRVASSEGYDAVVFLGRQTLARTELVSEATRSSGSAGSAMVVTHTIDPARAMTHVSSHLRTIRREARSGLILLILSDGVRVLKPADLESVPKS